MLTSAVRVLSWHELIKSVMFCGQEMTTNRSYNTSIALPALNRRVDNSCRTRSLAAGPPPRAATVQSAYSACPGFGSAAARRRQVTAR